MDPTADQFTAEVTNPFDHEVEFKWDGVEYVLPAKKKVTLVKYLALQAANKIAQILVNKRYGSDAAGIKKYIEKEMKTIYSEPTQILKAKSSLKNGGKVVLGENQAYLPQSQSSAIDDDTDDVLSKAGIKGNKPVEEELIEEETDEEIEVPEVEDKSLEQIAQEEEEDLAQAREDNDPIARRTKLLMDMTNKSLTELANRLGAEELPKQPNKLQLVNAIIDIEFKSN